MGNSFDWMPKWIGKRYSILWSSYKEAIFTYDDAEELLGKYTSNYLSEMKKAHTLFVFQKNGKKRDYRLLSPQIYIFSYANQLHLDWLKQGRYAHLLLKFLKLLKEDMKDNLLAIGIFGSVARGHAKLDSDIDLFIIVDEMSLSLLQRTKYLLKIKRQDLVESELDFLDKHNIHPKLNFFIREKNELRLNFFTLDISFDLNILYDEGVLTEYLHIIKDKIDKKGVKRKYLEDGRYYLDLNIEFGEVFEF
ncbi:MAG: hypothetical protein BAJALOKI3v1_100022 [Promethearchaeota archaeon]|jgi:predicted nucleotidyltransferase|nr:MAG: hypothetical protein BAJALOKI3v1_100022 [Candidatus Lokiarchaeota archaeon]